VCGARETTLKGFFADCAPPPVINKKSMNIDINLEKTLPSTIKDFEHIKKSTRGVILFVI